MRATLTHARQGFFLCVHIPRLSDDELIKQLGGRRVQGHLWRFPDASLYAHQIIREFGDDLIVDESASRRLDGWGFLRRQIDNPHRSWNKLHEFQKESVEYLLSSPFHGQLLRLSPGLGKTVVSIVAADLRRARSVLVIAPLSLLRTWEREITTWHDPLYPLMTISVCRGREIPNFEGWVITNYDTVARHPELYLRTWDLVILDESILVKNRQTKRVKSLRGICQKSRTIWALSGAPISRYVDDLWAQFHLLRPDAFTSYWRFAESYCIIETPPWGRGVVGTRKYDYQKEFHDLMFCKDQKDVLELPDVLYETIDLDLTSTQSRSYKRALDDFILELGKGEEISIPTRLAALTYLQEIVSNTINIDNQLGDHSSKADALEDLVTSGTWEFPMIIWTHWTSGARAIDNRLRALGRRVGLVTGDVSSIQGEPVDRDNVLQTFRSGGLDVFILSLGVGKYGLTLIEAKTIVYIDKTFSADDYIQSLYRVQRIGLNHSPVVVSLRCPGTVDELVADNLTGKSIDISRITNSDLSMLLRSLGQRV